MATIIAHHVTGLCVRRIGMGRVLFLVCGPQCDRVILAETAAAAFEEVWERQGSIEEIDGSVAIATEDRIRAFQPA